MRATGGFHGRKIQKTGGSTYIVSLPKNWVTSRSLKAGDVLSFSPRPDGSLVLQAEERDAPEVVRRAVPITNDMDEEHLFRRLVSEYIAGSTLLEIRTPTRMSARTRDIVRGFAQRVIGPEIIEETAESVVLQDVVGPNPLPIPSIIRRMHQMVRAMHADAMTAFHGADASIAKDVIDRDREVDRLHWFMEKQVNSALRDARVLASLALTLPDCSTYLLASRLLERIADHAVRIAGTIPMFQKERPPANVVGELERMAEAAAQALTRALESLEHRDIEAANAVIDAAQRLAEERAHILQEISTKRGRLAIGIAYVLESLERSASYAGDMAEIAINHAVETPAPTVDPPRSLAASKA